VAWHPAVIFAHVQSHQILKSGWRISKAAINFVQNLFRQFTFSSFINMNFKDGLYLVLQFYTWQNF